MAKTKRTLVKEAVYASFIRNRDALLAERERLQQKIASFECMYGVSFEGGVLNIDSNSLQEEEGEETTTTAAPTQPVVTDAESKTE